MHFFCNRMPLQAKEADGEEEERRRVGERTEANIGLSQGEQGD